MTKCKGRGAAAREFARGKQIFSFANFSRRLKQRPQEERRESPGRADGATTSRSFRCIRCSQNSKNACRKRFGVYEVRLDLAVERCSPRMMKDRGASIPRVACIPGFLALQS